MNTHDTEKLAALQKARITPYGEVTSVMRPSCTFASAARLNAATADIRWTLKDFAALVADKTFLRSPVFDFICGDIATEWSLAMMLKKDADKGGVHVGLSARTKTNALDVVYLVQLKVALVVDGAIEEGVDQQAVTRPYVCGNNVRRHYERLASSLDGLMSRCAQNDQLVVNASVTVYHAHANHSHRQMATLTTLFEQRAGDFVIRCGDGDVRVFKALLVGASPVFGALLATDMKKEKTGVLKIDQGPYSEGMLVIASSGSPISAATLAADMKDGILKIDDIAADTARALVKYLYIGQITEEMDAAALLIAANKYDMQQLKGDCVRYLVFLLSVDNAVAMFRLGKLHDAGKLWYEALLHINKEQWSAGDDVTEEDATVLLVEANRYDLKHAKEQCIRQLLPALSADNALALFEVAELHDAAALKQAALERIGVKLSSAIAADDWKTDVLPKLNEAFAKKM